MYLFLLKVCLHAYNHMQGSLLLYYASMGIELFQGSRQHSENPRMCTMISWVCSLLLPYFQWLSRGGRKFLIHILPSVWLLEWLNRVKSRDELSQRHKHLFRQSSALLVLPSDKHSILSPDTLDSFSRVLWEKSPFSIV